MTAVLEDMPTVLGRRQDWGTPGWLFDQMHTEFAFSVDAAAEPHNAKLDRFWSPEQDGLSRDWSGERIWCNPPYGSGIGSWTAKARAAEALSVLLLPVRSESEWWCRDVLQAAEIRFIRGRVHFELPPGMDLPPVGSRPVFASAIVVWDGLSGPKCSSFPTPRIADRERQRSLPLVPYPTT